MEYFKVLPTKHSEELKQNKLSLKTNRDIDNPRWFIESPTQQYKKQHAYLIHIFAQIKNIVLCILSCISNPAMSATK